MEHYRPSWFVHSQELITGPFGYEKNKIIENGGMKNCE